MEASGDINAGAEVHGMFAVRRDAEVAIIEIHRPEASNALRRQDKLDFIDLLAREASGSARAIVITGSGTRAFCAGTDIKEMATFSPQESLAMLAVEERMYEAVMSAPVPVIAAVQGVALGAGCVLVSCCDLVVAGESAKFGQPEVRNGAPAPLHVALLPRIIGLNRARWMLYTCQSIDAATAREVGLVSEVVSDGRVLSRAKDLALEIARFPRGSLALQKQIIDSWIRDSFDTAVRRSAYIGGSAFSSDEPRQAITTFLERPR
ncbi:enoyl-CoA hydratase/isomerase family protein [bacterium]|nr:MAG: enoyl-CoA hydratase/isomerase family protein [bacterium]